MGLNFQLSFYSVKRLRSIYHRVFPTGFVVLRARKFRSVDMSCSTLVDPSDQQPFFLCIIYSSKAWVPCSFSVLEVKLTARLHCKGLCAVVYVSGRRTHPKSL